MTGFCEYVYTTHDSMYTMTIVNLCYINYGNNDNSKNNINNNMHAVAFVSNQVLL